MKTSLHIANSNLLRSVFLAAGLSLAAEGGLSQSIVSTAESFISTDLVSGSRDAEGRRDMALVVDIKPGWKTYWRKPGDAGIPPRFDWTSSDNVQEVEIDWPRPSQFESFGLMTLGYADEVVLPLRVTPVDPSQPIALNGKLTLGVCSTICVIEETNVSYTISPDNSGTHTALITDWRARGPGAPESVGLTGATCRIAGAGEDRAFEALLALNHSLVDPVVVLEGPSDTWFHGTKIAPTADGLAVSSTLSVMDAAVWVGRGDVRITILAGGYAAEIQGCTAQTG